MPVRSRRGTPHYAFEPVQWQQQMIKCLLDFLDYNGYPRHQTCKRFCRPHARRKAKGNMKIEVAVNAIELAEHVDQIVLFSGDSEFCSLVEAVQRRGVRVTGVLTTSTQPPTISDGNVTFLSYTAHCT